MISLGCLHVVLLTYGLHILVDMDVPPLIWFYNIGCIHKASTAK